MKDIYEVLSRKEQLIQDKQAEIQQLEKQVEVLRAVIPMLCDDAHSAAESRRAAAAASSSSQTSKAPVMMAAGNGASAKVQEPGIRWP